MKFAIFQTPCLDKGLSLRVIIANLTLRNIDKNMRITGITEVIKKNTM